MIDLTKRQLMAEVLKAHQPTTDNEKHLHRCACGLEFHFVDARAWHRHAASMVLHALEDAR